jgi:hypothetical protein
MRKVVFTLNVNGYSPEITAITFPLMRYYAKKIGAEFRVIESRRFPSWPIVYEKMQIYDFGRDYHWIIFFDADTLVHPECIDFTCFLDEDTCAHNGQDMANIRFQYDEYFIKDKRNIGTCGWCTIAPETCINIWKPPDLSLQEILKRCRLTVPERNCGLMDDEHLVDDYVMSHNIAKFGIKHTTIKDLLPQIGLPGADFFWHSYTICNQEKVRQMKETLWRWAIPHPILFEGWDDLKKEYNG